MKKYFDHQMRKLQNDALAFASKYPEHARYLNLENVADRDPNIERLLEGFAYLTGRVQEQFDNGLQNVFEALVGTVDPQFLLSKPSKCIANFSVENLTSPQIIPKEKAKWLSKAVGEEETPCIFQLETDHNIYPIQVKSIEQKHSHNGKYQLSIHLICNAVCEQFTLKNFSFYIDANHDVRLKWLCHFLNKNNQASMTFQHNSHPVHIQHSYLNDEIASASQNGMADLIQDFFIFRDKFYFIDLEFDEALSCHKAESLVLTIISDESLPPHAIKDSSQLKLNCAVIVNQFEHAIEPLRISGNAHSYPIVADASRRKSYLLQNLLEVTANFHNQKAIKYLPLK